MAPGLAWILVDIVNPCPTFLVAVTYARLVVHGDLDLDFPRVDLATYEGRAFDYASPIHTDALCLTISRKIKLA